MSLRLLATRIATARDPSAAPHHHAAAGTRSAMTNAVPHVAISPKKRNTITSPRPSPAYGLGPPLYANAATSASAPTNRISAGAVASARASPANPATAMDARAAPSTAIGEAAPLATSLAGPTLSAVSTPRTPSK